LKDLKRILKKKNYHKISLTLTATNHFEVMGKINGVRGRFILDTGASNTCIGTDKIDYFHLISKESEVKAAGAGATDMETLLSTKNSLKLGRWKRKKQKIVLFDLIHINEALMNHKALPVDGIIGADILKKGKAIIDYGTSTLYLKKNK